MTTTPQPEADETSTAQSNEPDTAPVQYYGRSELPQQDVSLHRFSLRRKSTLIAISLFATLVFLIALTATATISLTRASEALASESARDPNPAQRTVNRARVQTLTLGTASMAALLTTMFIIVRIGPRIVALEFWIRRLGAGDLSYSVRPAGKDEITEIAYDLEVLRRQSVRAQQLDLVQELSDDLRFKNEELEELLVELRNTQDQLVSRRKLAELGELTAGVAHEIRNPLNLVQNFSTSSTDMMAELKETISALDGAPDPDEADLINELITELSENMDRIQNHCERTNRIVQDMLAMGRNTSGDYQNININQLVEDYAMLAYHSARNRDPQFTMNIIRELDEQDPSLYVVSEDIGRVILNLVGNACYATAQRSHEDSEYEPTMWLRTSHTGDTVTIMVRDNGSGIPTDVIDKIFNPFFTTKAADQGTGLGLSISNEIVRQHGGTITAESQPGEHTQFTISINPDRSRSSVNADPGDDDDAD